MRQLFLFICVLLFLNGFAVDNNKFTEKTTDKISLNSVWHFVKGDNRSALYPENGLALYEKINLPHTWNIADIVDDISGYYQGIGWYSKDLFIPKSYDAKKIYLFFEGANQVTELFVNGKTVGKHAGGYTAFRFDITNFINKESNNKIELKVDNSYSDDIAPISADFTFYGGIYRDVFLEVKNPIHFDMANYASSGLFVDNEINGNTAKTTIRGKLCNESGQKVAVKIKTTITDYKGNILSQQVSKPINLAPNSTVDFKQLCVLNSFDYWSPDSPVLYRIENQVISAKGETVYDKNNIKTAYRVFKIDSLKGITLNGKKIKLIGTNRHQDFPGVGNALTDDLHRQDIKILKDMGANFIRIAHYPQDEALLEACDELGIIAWEEISVVNQIGRNEIFVENTKTNLIEMIRQHYNHPSIAFWGYMNEVLLGKYKYKAEEKEKMFLKTTELAKKLDSIAHAEDQSRFTVIANHNDYENYKATKLNETADICGWNLYFGWYNEGFDGFDKFVEKYHKEYPQHPIIISEYGAGSDGRINTDNPIRFDNSMQWFEKYHEEYLSRIIRNDAIAGAAAWNLIDFNSEGRGDTNPHINNKGILYQNREPKDIYFFYKAVLSKQAVLKIATGKWIHRVAEIPVVTKTLNQKIKVYSNLQHVEMFLNGKSLGKQQPDSIKKIYFDVPFESGMNTLEVIGVANDGNKLSDKIEIQYDFIPNPLSDASFKEINVNVGAHFDFIEPTEGYSWIHDKEYTKGSWGSIGGQKFTIWNGFRIGSDKAIDNTEKEGIYQTQCVGLNAYRFDVADGWYEIEMYFAELQSSKELKQLNMNNLGLDSSNEKIISERIFDVKVNNETVLKDFNISKEVGEASAYKLKIRVSAENNQGINISFDKKVGEPVLNGVRVRRI